MRRVEIPNVGLVDFPDLMSDADIVFAIETDILKTPKQGFFSQLKDDVVKAITPESKYKSVVSGMDGKVIDARTAIERKGAPVTDGTFKQVKSAYENANPSKREELSNRGDWLGSVTSEVDSQYQNVKEGGIGDKRKEAKINNAMRNSNASFETARNIVEQGGDGLEIDTITKGMPEREVVDYALDAARSSAKIVPATGKMVVDVVSLGTAYIPYVGDMIISLGEGLDEAIKYQSSKQSPELKQKAFELQELAKNSTGVKVAEFLAANPALLADIAIPSIGFTLISGGVGAGATKFSTEKASQNLAAKYAGRNAQAIEALAERYGRVQGTNAAIATNVAVNAGGAFGEAEGDARARYTAAAIAGIATLAGGKLTKGGAEGAIARGNVGATGRAINAAKVGGMESLQEYTEGSGQALGVQTGEFAFGNRQSMDFNQINNQGVMEAMAALGTGATVGALQGSNDRQARIADEKVRLNSFRKQLEISNGTESDDITSAKLQAKYEAEQKQALADNAIAVATNPNSTVDDTLAVLNDAIGTPLDYSSTDAILNELEAIPASDLLDDSTAFAELQTPTPDSRPAQEEIFSNSLIALNELMATGTALDPVKQFLGEDAALAFKQAHIIANDKFLPLTKRLEAIARTRDISLALREAVRVNNEAYNAQGDNNVSTNDAVTSMAAIPSEPTYNNIQGSVGDIPNQSARWGVDNTTATPSPSIGENVPAGIRSTGNDAVTQAKEGDIVAIGDSQFKKTANGFERVTSETNNVASVTPDVTNVDTVNTTQERVDETPNNVQVNSGNSDRLNVPNSENNSIESTTNLGNSRQTVGNSNVPKVVLQNRDRSQPESINQMRLIAANPDPSRLSFSRDAANGAPVVAGELPVSAVLGKLDHALTANNRKLPMQYAVVEASDVIASHDVNGIPIAEYGNSGKLQAIGGNGRVAGLQEAYRNSNGNNYAQGIAEDSALHGVPAEAIQGMKNPVLIRVMNSADITPTIGDELNGRTNMGLSVLEQAKTDTARLKLEALDFNENGEVTQDAIKAFVMAMPENERNELMDGGRVGRKAEERLMAAIFSQAYNDDELVRIYSQAQDVESKAVINALAIAAPAMSRLKDAGNLDIRSIVADAAKVAVNSSRQGVSLTKLAAQGDLELGNDVMAIVRFMAQNIRKPKAIAEALTGAAQFAYGIANEKTMAMFDMKTVTRDDIIRKVTNDYQGSQENLGEQGRGQPNGGNVGREATNARGQNDTQTPQSLELTGQTNEEINAGIAAKEAAERASKAEEAKLKAEQLAKDTADNQLARNPDNFTFGESSDEAASKIQDNLLDEKPAESKTKAKLNRKTGYVLVGKDTVAVLHSDNGKKLSVYGLDKVKEADREQVKNELRDIASSTGYEYEESSSSQDEVTPNQYGTSLSELKKLRQELSDKIKSQGTVTNARDEERLKQVNDAISEAENKDSVDADKAKAQADLDSALGDLGDIFGKSYRKNITPEQEQKLIPVLTRLFDAAFRLGYYEFKDATKFVIDTIRSKIGTDVAETVTIDQLQGAYISMAGKYGDKATSKRDVVNVESIKDILEGNENAGSTKAENVPNGRAQSDLLTEQSGNSDSKPLDSWMGAESESSTGQGRVSSGVSETSGSGATSTSGSDRNESPSGSRKTSNAGNTTSTTDGLGNFEITDETGVGEGSLAKKYKDNITAIKLIKTLESENRNATPEERNQLAKYNGFGALSKVFEKNNPNYKELKDLLTEEEYAAAKASILNAYFTSPALVKSMYEAVQHLGFKSGRVLEPSMGSGNFFGLMPANMRNKSKLNGVELDVITSRLAKYLYPNANIAVATGFEKYQAPQGYFDLVVSNPPFGSEKITDSDRTDYSGFSIHNYFIAKSIDKLRNDGLLAVVVTHGFMDASDTKAREWISKRAILRGAIRLPKTAFKDNAGTEVITDILFFQKTNMPESNPDWVNSSDHGDYFFNDYFSANPMNVLGRVEDITSQYGKTYTVEPTGDMNKLIKEFITARLPADVYIEPEQRIEVLDSADNAIPDGVKVGTFYKDEKGVIRQRLPDMLGAKRSTALEIANSKALERISGMMDLRDLLRNQMRLERDGMATEKDIEANRKKLNSKYDAYLKEFGYLNSMTNRRLFLDDTESALVQALEVDYDQGVSASKALSTGMEKKEPSAKKADIFARRVLFPPSDSITVSNAKDALLASLNVKGNVDVDYMAEVYNKSKKEIISELGDVVYNDPNRGYTTADEYLSGDVKTKLTEARAYAKTNSEFNRNVEALEKVIPKDKLPSEIYASAGANWIPADIYEAFTSEITGIPKDGIEFTYVSAAAMWVNEKTKGGDLGKMTSDYGTGDINSFDLFTMVVNGKSPEVREMIGYGSDRRSVVNIEKTEAARSKYEKIKETWNSWIFKDADRADLIATIYNDKHNRTVARKFDGSHMKFYGMSPSVQLRPHQADVVWRAIQDRNVLLDHVVGAGKTMAMAAVAMEMKRLGIARKPMFVVPNHLTLQWRSEFTKLYPSSNILAATPEDFAKDKREKMFSKMVTGDYDAIIIGHSSLKKVGLPAGVEEKMYAEQVKEIADAIEVAKTARGDRGITRDMEKIKKNLEAKIDKLKQKTGTKDDVVSFDELGIDALFVDEMHEFKNLFFTTQMQRTAGLGNPAGSGKALDLFMKVRFMQDIYGEDAPLITATGTPVSNSLAEMYTMQRYMKYKQMKRQDLHLFDAWAKQFGEVENVYEVAPSGVGYRQSTRFSKFKNLPALMGGYTGFADIITMQDLKDQSTAAGKVFPVPNLKSGKPINVIAKRSELQRDFFGVPQLAVNENTGEIQFEMNPSEAGIEVMDNGKYRLSFTGGFTDFDTREDAELELVSKSLLPKTFIDPNSLLGKFANLATLTRETKGKINALSLTGLANKAGLDYRLIDPNAQDFEGSKINESVTNMVQLWKDTTKDKGTQIVFCDMSIPNSARNRSSSVERYALVRDNKGQFTHKKATLHTVSGFEGFPYYVSQTGSGENKRSAIYEPMSGVMLRDGLANRQAAAEYMAALLSNDSGRDRIFALRDSNEVITKDDMDEYFDLQEKIEIADDYGNLITPEDLEAVAGSASFSVYDDIKAKLIKSGVPEVQIAFIHDFNTPKQKEELFKRVNNGEVRFLFGSTPKLGAGTNVQKRLVGLHHIDAPWRPSDLEQREGRIIRQGNDLYARDPEGFEIAIWRYATEQTYDTRRWQLLEHKAAGIEQLRKYTGEAEIEDVASEASNSADMKAAASGNPLILEETKLRSEKKRLVNLEKAHEDSQYSMARKIKQNETTANDFLPRRIAKYEELIKTVGAYPIPADKLKIADIVVDGKRVATKEAAENELAAVTSRIKNAFNMGDIKVIKYRGVEFTVERGMMLGTLKLSSPDGTMHTYGDKEGVSPSGLIIRFNNYIDSFDARIEEAKQNISSVLKENESLSSRIGEAFEFADKLKEVQAEHANVQRRLMKSSQLEAIPDNQRAEFDRLVKARKEDLQKLGYEKALKESENDSPAYSTTATKVAADKQLSIATISKEVEKLVSKFSAPIPVIIKETGGIVDGGTVSGMVSKGNIYLFQDGISDIASVEVSLWHELLHYGLRRFLTKDQYITKLNDLYMNDAWIRGRANDWIKTETAQSLVGKESSAYIRARGVDEALAEISENGNRGGYSNTNIISKTKRTIARWIAKLADLFGFKNVADIYRGISNDEARDLIKNTFARLETDENPTSDNWAFTSSTYKTSKQQNLEADWTSLESSKMDALVYTLQDKHVDLKRVTQAIKDTGRDISDRWNAYLQEELYHGRTAKRTQDFIKHDLDPLIAEMRMRGVAMADFEEYLWARHAEERNIQIAKVNPDMQDGGSGMTTQEANDYLANLSASDLNKYKALSKRVDAINKKSRQVLINYGLESTDTISAWEGAYKNYVPLMREDMDAGFGHGTGQGFSVKGNSSKRATGSNRAVVDIIANIAQQYEKNIIRGEKNRVSTALIGLAKLNPNDEFWKVDTPPTITSINKATGLVETRTDPNYKSRDNVVVARIVNKVGKIEERSVVFNEFDERSMRMARSIKNLDQDQIGELLGVASSITRYFASINTQYNPIFGVINITRDVQAALLNLSTTPIADKKKEVLKNTPSALLGIYKDLRSERKTGAVATSKWSSLFEEFQREGGQTGYRDMYANAKERGEALKNALDPTWWKESKIGKLVSLNGAIAKQEQWAFDKAIKPIFDWLSDYNNALENAVRLSVYKVALDNGQSKQQAASIAKNISVNFNRKGEMGRQIGSLYAFFNASVQGTARIGETLLTKDDAGKVSLSKTGKRIVQGGLLLGAMQALILAAAGYDEDEPPEFIRDRNIIIPLDMVADGKYITIPMPLGFNAIPAFGRIVTEWALSGGEDTSKRLVHIIGMLLDVTNPIGNAGLSLQTITPTVVDPVAALAENKDFTGKPISREDFSSLDPTAGFTRSRDKAWWLSVGIARGINWATGGTDRKQGVISPTADQLEYLAGQFTGGVGREVIKAGTTVDSLLTGDDLPTYKIPFVGRFYGDTTGQSSQGSKFYQNIRDLNEHDNEIKGLREDGGNVKEYLEENPEARLKRMADISMREVSSIRKRQRIMKDNDASKESIKALDDRITAIMKRLNERVTNAKEKKAV